MRKITIAIVSLLLMAAPLMAAPVTEATAHRVAVNFWNTYRPREVKPVASLQSLAFPELQHLYVFANGEEGFIVVASDDRVRPVVGYSFDSPFPTRLHPELRYWLSIYEMQIADAVTTDADANPRWGRLLTDDVIPEPVSLQNVPALCHTRWDQLAPYSDMCPFDSNYGDHAVVGCVATAMAQIMKRWNHPSCGTGNHSYEYYLYGTISADFEHTTYMWEMMPNYVSVSTSDERKRALSTLSFHCGVAVNMMYGTVATGGSGAYSSCGPWTDACAEHAFYEFFKYDTSLQFRTRHGYSDSQWLAMIDEDLANGRPIYYAGSDTASGHAFVLDGSDLDTMYHFNWGWSGFGDGFYAMSDLSPRVGGTGSNSTHSYNMGQEAIFGIKPAPETFDTIVLYDTICTNYSSYENYGYTLPVASDDTNLRYLDTIFELHLSVIESNIVTYSANVGMTSGIEEYEYCEADGIVTIECPFTRNNYHFIGWSTERTGTPDTLYQPGSVVHVHGNVTLYARWKKNSSEGVDEVEETSVSLWPNPTTGELTVAFEEAQEAQVQVLDAVGRTVLREGVSGGAKISLSALPDGVYTVQVRTSAGVYNQRVIKQ